MDIPRDLRREVSISDGDLDVDAVRIVGIVLGLWVDSRQRCRIAARRANACGRVRSEVALVARLAVVVVGGPLHAVDSSEALDSTESRVALHVVGTGHTLLQKLCILLAPAVGHVLV